MTALYRHFDADGRLLYVGIARSVTARLAQHADSPWDDQIARVEVERFATREEAEAAEREAIRAEKPIHNRAHNGTNNDVAVVLAALGRLRVRLRLNLSQSSLTDAIADGKFPAPWYAPMKALADEKGVELPLCLFNWRKDSAA